MTRGDKFNKLRRIFTKATDYIHAKKGFKNSQFDDKPIQDLIKETNKVLQSAIAPSLTHEIPAVAREMYKRDVFIFSGMKSYAALKEASGMLLDDKGNIKPLAQFRKDIEPIKDAQYHRYIPVEYQFAKSSVQSAAQWHQYQADGDRYDLQIRTAGDDHVRASHAVLNDLTLPTNDKFWLTHWTPFDWGCRCRIIQVLRGKYAATDPEMAQQLGNQAVREEFRFNPGVDGVVFPPKHPYFAQHCNGAKLSVALIRQVRIVLENESDKCGWQKKLGDQHSQKNIAFDSRYALIKFEKVEDVKGNGVLEIPVNAGQKKEEYLKNKNALTIAANAGYKFRMLPVLKDGLKNPDAVDLKTKQYTDVKVPDGKNAFNFTHDALKYAAKQNCSQVLIHIKDNPDSYRNMFKAFDYLIERGRAESIKNVIVIFPNNKIKEFDIESRRRKYKKTRD